MRHLIDGFCTALCVAILTALFASARPSTKTTFEIMGPADHGEVWVRPMVAPMITFKPVKGSIPESGERNVVCSEKTVKRGEQTFIHLVCGSGLELEMTGIDLIH